MEKKDLFVLIIGAKSDIALALARGFAEEGYSLYLSARTVSDLEERAKDLTIRYGVSVKLKELDVTDFSSHLSFVQSLDPFPYGVVYCAGYLPDQKKAEKDWKETEKTLHVNFTGAVSLLNCIADRMEERGEGFIVGISSVAGDRGRKSNYIYGSAKAGFSAYLSGLRGRLFRKKIVVMTVKPGFVQTKMTRHLSLPPLLTASPEEVAKGIIQGIKKKKEILNVRKIWWWIMLVLKVLPESVFKRVSF